MEMPVAGRNAHIRLFPEGQCLNVLAQPQEILIAQRCRVFIGLLFEPPPAEIDCRLFPFRG